MNTPVRPDPEYPAHDAPEVAATREQCWGWIQGQSRLHGFLRGYCRSSLTRLAMNVVMLRRLLRPGMRWLDVGGFGIETVWLKREVDGLATHALSLEGNRIGLGEEGFFETTRTDDPSTVLIDQVDVETEPFPYEDNSFDVVTCFEVLEHLKLSPVPMVKEMKRVLRAEGAVILTTPNINSYPAIDRILSGQSPQECPLYHRDPGYGIVHPREYTLAEVSALFRGLGYDVSRLTTLDTAPMLPGAHRLKRLGWLLELLFAADSGGRGEKILLVASKGGPVVDEYPSELFSG